MDIVITKRGIRRSIYCSALSLLLAAIASPTFAVHNGVAHAPDLDITKSASTSTVTPGGTITFNIRVENDGDSPALNSVVTDDLDDSLTIVSTYQNVAPNSPGNAGPCSVAAGNVVTCTLGTIAPQPAAQGPNAAIVEIVVTAPATQCSYSNTAVASESDPGPNGGSKDVNQANNTATTSFSISPCLTSVSASVVKNNDANNDGIYTDSETAAGAASVKFRATITNHSGDAIRLTSLDDNYPGGSTANLCSLENTTLASAASTTCDWTESNYAPTSTSSAQSKTNTVALEYEWVSNPAITGTATDTSVVNVAASGTTAVLGVEFERQGQLPLTGPEDLLPPAALALLMILVGASVLRLSRNNAFEGWGRPVDTDKLIR